MWTEEQAVLLRIYCGESDRAGHAPLYEALIEQARALDLAGATVLRGPLGFGRSHRLHAAKILALAEDLPLVVEIVDTAERIDAFLAAAADRLRRVLVTREAVTVLRAEDKTAPPSEA